MYPKSKGRSTGNNSKNAVFYNGQCTGLICLEKNGEKTGSQKIVDLGQFPSLLFKVTDIQLDDDIQSKKCPK